MSSYTGLYTQQLSNGTIYSVQVVDPGGNSLPLEPAVYVARQIKPLIDELPDVANYKPAPPKPKISPVILALADWVEGKEVPGEVLNKMQQFGFIFPDQDGQLKLTPSGAQTLREIGRV
ncbi:hypothetical protein [Halothiobacillus neapolitanus]|uniref:Uncharacterized protein n=1 Tax=Halothiobacillus neapolitanus (strain ATCC 23641 / DSM 15147 / CIP 104769 / NCIMB 8539 / c2) TaxID=555778 RepID=D0L1B3_HALNC|nr:hypothetical protein [Halothiobacillus neapolitanus]ACX96486.1 hypothetical protein Hneap_1660 [Halothiobacillus neapolitanus c2]TDN57340.1 hypothetical protein C8D83_1164 [Halothiobacillus neapolitanus]